MAKVAERFSVHLRPRVVAVDVPALAPAPAVGPQRLPASVRLLLPPERVQVVREIFVGGAAACLLQGA